MTSSNAMEGAATRRPVNADDASLAVRRDRFGRFAIGLLIFGGLAWLFVSAALNPPV